MPKLKELGSKAGDALLAIFALVVFVLPYEAATAVKKRLKRPE